MNVLGVDVGLSGGLVLLSESGNILEKTVMPIIDRELDTSELVRLITTWNKTHGIGLVLIEKVGAMPSNGAVSMFKFGKVAGTVHGIVAALGLPYQLVGPKIWQKPMHLGCQSDDPKARSLMAVSRLYPGIDLRANSRCKIQHDGLVDALLIARYGISL